MAASFAARDGADRGKMPMMEPPEKIRLGDLNFVESLREQTRGCDGEIVERDGLVLMRGHNPHPLHNNAVRLDPAVDAARCFEIAHDFYDEKGHGFIFALLNGQPSHDLAIAAEQAGLLALQAPPAMFVEHRLHDVPLDPECEIREVRDASGLEDYSAVSQVAWATYGIPGQAIADVFARACPASRPHLRAVVGYRRGEPVSAALVLFSHGIAGVYWVGTVPSARGCGMGEACTRAVTNMGFDAGSPLVTLQASPMGEPIYRRMGYESLGTYRLCVHLGRARPR